ncbi:arginase [Pseudoalteromonas phenolica]|uniref:Arginase n=1 Tax=Pseudoalteromonas phenolica TaxID=161398 RepID=A0A4Q7IS56_9GAMM|nr:formimidoylglutamase [Pseudoalteromonas phenolica]RZQ54655.1 arginase [Pseudoalteromonas phenolica]
MSEWLVRYSEADINHFTTSRANETRFWQSISFLDQSAPLATALKDAAEFGIRYVLIGINEDIGPRANCGRGGATQGWQAFLKRFLNLPSNEFLDPKSVLLLGEVQCSDLQSQSQKLDNSIADDLTHLRNLCSELDERVTEVLKPIFDSGLEAIVIGGGHNNCYPILKALSTSEAKPCNAINFDPHADFRAIEGRHSGNGFNYAYQGGYLNDYHVVGMHEQKNNQTIISALTHAGFTYTTYQTLQVMRSRTLTSDCQHALARFKTVNPLGIEVDVDAISGMPVSAFTNCGFSVSDAEHFVYLGATHSASKYLHLCEAAPEKHPIGLQQGITEVGQVLSGLVCSYLLGKQQA